MTNLMTICTTLLMSTNVFASTQEDFLGSLGLRAQQAHEQSHAAWSRMMAIEDKPDFQSATFAGICSQADRVQELVKSIETDLRSPEARRWVLHRREALRILQTAALSGNHAAKSCATRDPHFAVAVRHALVDQSRALQNLLGIL